MLKASLGLKKALFIFTGCGLLIIFILAYGKLSTNKTLTSNDDPSKVNALQPDRELQSDSNPSPDCTWGQIEKIIANGNQTKRLTICRTTDEQESILSAVSTTCDCDCKESSSANGIIAPDCTIEQIKKGNIKAGLFDGRADGVNNFWCKALTDAKAIEKHLESIPEIREYCVFRDKDNEYGDQDFLCKVLRIDRFTY